MSLTVREVLLKAAETCERGWCQGRKYLRGADGEIRERCMWGGICEVAGEWQGADGGLPKQAIDAVGKHVGESAINWQDKLGRTQAEVVAALRAAAEAQGGA